MFQDKWASNHMIFNVLLDVFYQEDADNVDLVDSKLNPATRDIVQFVKYNDYQGDIGLLAEQVLCEVPD